MALLGLLPPDEWVWEKTIPLTAEAEARQAAADAARLAEVLGRCGLDPRTSPSERARGYVRPLRLTVEHHRTYVAMQSCGGRWQLRLGEAQLLAGDPESCPVLHCPMCGRGDRSAHFNWAADGRVVGS